MRIVDASGGWNPWLDLSRDGIHPTAAGQLRLAQAVRGAAQAAFCAP